MKSLFFLGAFLCALGIKSQCPTESVVLDSQEAIDDFSSNYPNCTNFQETLIVEEGNGLVDNLLGLGPLTYIKEFKVRFTHLINFEGLDALETIEALEVSNNIDLINFEGLESVQRVDIINVFDNPTLSSLSGFSGLTTVEHLNLFDNIQLSSLQSFGGLQFIESIRIAGNQIQSLEGFENITTITEEIFISNEQLISLDAFSGLANFSGSLYFWNNSQLIDFSVFEQVTQLENLLVVACDQVQNLEGFASLEVVDDFFRFGFNPQLNTLSAFANLHSVGSLDIYENALLESLEGLEQLTMIRDNVYLLDNPSLNDISALDQVQPFGLSEVVISRNPNLAVCDNAFICSVIFDPDIAEEIQSNANGCNSVPQVAVRCILADESMGDGLVNGLYPNPVRHQFFVDLAPGVDLISVTIFQGDGRQVLRADKPIMDLSFLPSGLYFAAIQTTYGSTVKKVVKH